jgi:hypothetical protein
VSNYLSIAKEFAGQGIRAGPLQQVIPKVALPIHDDVRFGAWAALGDFGRTGSFGYFTV